MSNNKHETETNSVNSKEAEASQGNRLAQEAVASQTAPETPSGHEKAKSGSDKKTRGPAAIPHKMRNLRTGAPFDWDEYEKNEDYTSFEFPLSRRVALAAHYIDRSISPEFTAAVMSFLH
ncbi:hypothetical protein SLS64_003071 [Diaporthe eres]|uniref:Uncharacterized protein n=1 Tax=Diaporthe eres TaxID=83184 RepID=A0ABR1PDM7_DIAER